MINFKVTSEPLFEQTADCYAFTFEEGFTPALFSKTLKQLTKEYLPDLPMIMKERQFTGKLLDTFVLPIKLRKKIVHCIFFWYWQARC